MDNATRRELLNKAKSVGYTGNILDVFSAHEQGRDLIGEFMQSQQPQVAMTPEEQQQGLRPAHEAGNTNQSMVFPNVQPGQSFNTVGMKAPIDINKVDSQGNLVESYKSVPPGIQNLPTGPYAGTVIESPAKSYASGGTKTDPPTKKKIYTDPLKFAKAKEIHDDSLSDYLKNKNIYESYSGAVYKQTYDEIAELAEKNKRDYGWAKSNYPQKPKVEPVYKEKPKEYIPTKTPKLEIEPIQLIIPQSDRTLMPYNNTLQVLQSVKQEDVEKQKPKVVKAPNFETGGPNIGGVPMPTLPQEEPVEQPVEEPMQPPQVQQHMQTSPMGMGSHLTPFMQKGQSGELYYDASSQIQAPQPEDTTVKQYFIGGLKTKAINRFANGGPGDPPPSTDDWYKTWYSKRQELPQFKEIAGQRLDYLNANKTNVQTIPDDKMKELSGSENTIGLYYPSEEVEADKYGNKVLVTDRGLKEQGDTLVAHETSHLLDWNAPQKNTTLYFKNNPRVKNYKDLLPILEEGDASITKEEIRLAKEQALSDSPDKWRDPMYRVIPSNWYSPREAGKEDTMQTGFKSQGQVNYQYSPTELRARLNVWRKEMNLDPTKDYSIEEIDSMIKNNQGVENPNIKELYKLVRGNPEMLKEFHDTYVMNPTRTEQPTYTAKLGGLKNRVRYNKAKYKR